MRGGQHLRCVAAHRSWYALLSRGHALPPQLRCPSQIRAKYQGTISYACGFSTSTPSHNQDTLDGRPEEPLAPVGSAERVQQLRDLMHDRRQALVRLRAASLKKVAITGARSNSGRYISDILWRANPTLEIVNLTGNPKGREWASNTCDTQDRMQDLPFNFDQPAKMRHNLEGADALILTYWERSPLTAAEKAAGKEWPALMKVRALIDAAADAGVRRVVYVSHTRPELGHACGISYITGKLQAEQYLRERMPAKTAVACVRPCCIFSETAQESVVVNNMAAVLGLSPAFLVHREAQNMFFQPVHARDLAFMAVDMVTRPQEEAISADPESLLPAANSGREPSLSGTSTQTEWAQPADAAVHLGSLDAVSAERPSVIEFLKTIRTKVNERRPLLRGTAVPPILPVLPGLVADFWLIPEMLNTLLDDDFVDTEEFWIMHQNVACSAHARCPALAAAEEQLVGRGTLTRSSAEVLTAVEEASARLPYWGRSSFSAWVHSQADLGQEYINSYRRYYGVSGRREHFRKRAK